MSETASIFVEKYEFKNPRGQAKKLSCIFKLPPKNPRGGGAKNYIDASRENLSHPYKKPETAPDYTLIQLGENNNDIH